MDTDPKRLMYEAEASVRAKEFMERFDFENKVFRPVEVKAEPKLKLSEERLQYNKKTAAFEESMKKRFRCMLASEAYANSSEEMKVGMFAVNVVNGVGAQFGKVYDDSEWVYKALWVWDEIIEETPSQKLSITFDQMRPFLPKRLWASSTSDVGKKLKSLTVGPTTSSTEDSSDWPDRGGLVDVLEKELAEQVITTCKRLKQLMVEQERLRGKRVLEEKLVVRYDFDNAWDYDGVWLAKQSERYDSREITSE